MVFDRRHLYMVSTSNYLNSIPSELDAQIRTAAISKLGTSVNKYGEYIPDFIIFDPRASHDQFEDEGRSLRLPMNIPRGDKVYVKLDNYGSQEELSRHVGHTVSTQFVVTFMMAEDY
jgi:hypothetical protein